ncbi:monovalent cation/H(+) antiporter subunit G [Amnibacterium endophyticum]|uniref:Monovalent cation/H(+) antiporter subunit G n=1 Tax=Amnibacterium endophyticum TaxID=2109337 RepID=A0ABW4LIK5_9MICO
MSDLIAQLLLLAGALFALASGVGLLRFRDALARLHAGTKPQVLGLVCVLAAIAIGNDRWDLVPALVPVLVLQMITIPVSGHMIARAAYRTGNFREDRLSEDELAPAIEEASRRDAEDRERREDREGPEAAAAAQD